VISGELADARGRISRNHQNEGRQHQREGDVPCPTRRRPELDVLPRAAQLSEADDDEKEPERRKNPKSHLVSALAESRVNGFS
jgi:hypothetical protein